MLAIGCAPAETHAQGGAWTGTLTCYGEREETWPFTLGATPLATAHYDVEVKSVNAQGRGSIVGSRVHFTVGNLVVKLECEGDVSGDGMAGRCNRPEPDCNWRANRVLPR